MHKQQPQQNMNQKLKYDFREFYKNTIPIFLYCIMNGEKTKYLMRIICKKFTEIIFLKIIFKPDDFDLIEIQRTFIIFLPILRREKRIENKTN